jgi:anaerobic dimethyl sulfoxide reductase subunit A
VGELKGLHGEIPVSCNRDCGAGCPLAATVRRGRLLRIRDNPLRPPTMVGCQRGYRTPHVVYAPDRVLRPLLLDGPRGSGRYREASWEEALELVARKLLEIRGRHGAQAVLCLGGSGSCRGALHNTELLTRRFLALYGGCTLTTGGYSSAAERFVAPYLFGTLHTGLDSATLQHSKLVLLWGANVVDTRFGCELENRLRELRRGGVEVIAIDPRRSRTAARLASRWIAVRPGTDTALMAAVLHELLVGQLVDREFIARFSVGFEELERYVYGEQDGQPKTPDWAEAVCGTPAAEIRWLSETYGRVKPAALIPGLSIQRTLGGEEAVRMAAALQVATGNVGRPGGSTGGNIWGRLPRPVCGSLPVPEPPAGAGGGNPATIPVYRWADAVLEGRSGGYPSEIRAVYNVGANYVCTGSDVAKNVRAFQSLQFAVCHDFFLTPTARHCDVVLPATTFLEREDIVFPEGNYLFYSAKAIDPVGHSRNDYDIFWDLAERLGFGEAFSEGREASQWLQEILSSSEVADAEEFRRTGIHQGREQMRTALSEFISDPQAHPLATPSGRIEISSAAYGRLGFCASPVYRGAPPDPRHPLSLITPHARHRVNSQLSNDAWFGSREPQRLWLNPRDAAPRGIAEGAEAEVRSPQGRVRVRVRVTGRIMPGVACLLAGAWPAIDGEGVDRAGAPNLLTSTTPTEPSQGSRTHSVAVEVRAVPRGG